jgi:hypothetical protein
MDGGIGVVLDSTPTIDATAPAATDCQALTTFKAHALTELKNNCASCHAGSEANAVASMDLTKIDATSDAELVLACDQIRSRINLQNPDDSGFYLAPDPDSISNHAFKFPNPTSSESFATFKTAVDIWVKAELVTP